MKMKNKNIIVVLIALLLTTTGCQDFLDTKLDTFQTPEMLVTQRGTLYSLATAFYTPLRYGFTALDGNLFCAATDEAQQTVIGGNALIFNLGIMNSKSIPENLYKNYYEGIRASNKFLEFYAQNPNLLKLNRDTVADAVNYNNDKLSIGWYLAEAHIAKAYYYFELIKRYGGVPIIKSSLENTSVDSIYVKRSSYDDVVNYIVSEIDNNKANLQVNWKTSTFTTSEGRFTLVAALAIKTRVLLFAASPLNNPSNDISKWQRAAAAAIELYKTTGLGLGLESSYANYFKSSLTSTSKETIFGIRGGANNTPEKLNYPIATTGGGSGICPTQNLVDAYETLNGFTYDPANPYVNRDPRFAASVAYNGATWNNRTILQAAGDKDDQANANASRTGYYLKKFLTDNLNLVQGTTEQHTWPVYRYGEFLLEYAEALNQACGPDGTTFTFNGATYTAPITAKAAIALVRKRASTSLLAVTTTDPIVFNNAVKHERQVELAFEDYRYWDLLRWKDAEIVLNQPVQGMKIKKTNTGTDAAPVWVYSYQKVNVATRTFVAPTNYYYPLAYSDVVLSNNTLEQNTGY